MSIYYHDSCKCITGQVPTPSVTPTTTPTNTQTPSSTVTPTQTLTISPTPTITPTIGGGGGGGGGILPSPTPTQTTTITSTPTLTVSISPTPTITVTLTPSITPSSNDSNNQNPPLPPINPEPPSECESGDVYDPVSLKCVKPQIKNPDTPSIPEETIPCEPNGESIVFNGYAFYKNTPAAIIIQGIGDLLVPECYGGHKCDRTEFIPKILLGNGTIIEAPKINLNNLNDGGDREASFQFTIESCKIGKNIQFMLDCNSKNTFGISNCHQGVVWIIITFEDPVTKNIKIVFNGCVSFGTWSAIEIACEENCPEEDPGTGYSPNIEMQSSSVNILSNRKIIP